MRIGIDVGGTHTDAVLLSSSDVIASTKALTTADVLGGVTNALDTVLATDGVEDSDIEAVMIGTTQFTNAVVERRELSQVAAIRIGLPSGAGLPPMADWPDDIADVLGRHTYMIHGGTLYDGWSLADLRDGEIDAVIEDLKKKKLTAAMVSAAFSPMNAEPERIVAERIAAAIPGMRVTQSHTMGRLGIMERENAALLNTALLGFANRVVGAFNSALKQRGLNCPMYVSQNDGTLMSADFVKQFPALTFASGPTNSLRGASKLTGLKDAIVVDIGGTTSDIGVLQDGFPRESNVVIEVGGVRTNFRMPDILAVGLGGGSIVADEGTKMGPQSVGHKLVTEGLVFGGKTLTATDIVVAAGSADVGDKAGVAGLDRAVIEAGIATIHRMLDQNIDMMKPNSDPVPVILVGGGALLVTGDLKAASKQYRPENAGVANAIGAAIAQIGGETERLLSYRETPREEAVKMVTAEATAKAVAAGADAATIRVADIEETAIPYMDEGATRLRVKVVGDIAALNKAGENA
ncbi:hydantoinase/oxoprolinase family protein [Kordiimonas aquimaris]|uniref:hydantoinase/oxoprolinase family protein n=1 Tax=Kordiimonas aquimaris TaxID=707591 RepID=UPI0021D027AE|nr:hydantoinase/oxoprolinase family protein [Kordiimonas aquimaris]